MEAVVELVAVAGAEIDAEVKVVSLVALLLLRVPTGGGRLSYLRDRLARGKPWRG